MSAYILHVEDSDDDIMLMHRSLKQLGVTMNIVVAKDGVEALDAVFGEKGQTTPSELPCLILLDLKLPKMNGLEVLERLTANPTTQAIPVVCVSSSREELAELQKREDLSITALIPKQFGQPNFTEKLSIISQYCSQ